MNPVDVRYDSDDKGENQKDYEIVLPKPIERQQAKVDNGSSTSSIGSWILYMIFGLVLLAIVTLLAIWLIFRRFRRYKAAGGTSNKEFVDFWLITNTKTRTHMAALLSREMW